MIASRLVAVVALSIALGAPAPAQPASQTILVWSYGFSPRPIYLRAGQPVTLTFVNRSGSSHDFVARTFFGNSRILSGDAREGEIDLRGGETKTVRLVPRAGTYSAHCSHFFHKQLGMSDQIIVQ
jgi:plastocyanin